MEIELRYLAEMEKNGLKKADLPKDAQTGITEINKILKAVNMLEKQDKTVKPETIDKIKTLDKWVYYEILDHVNDTNNNEGEEKPVEAEEVIKEAKENAEEEKEEESPEQKQANAINQELESLHNSEQSEFSIDEVKAKAKKCYDAIFENYEEGAQNGVETQYYSLLETEKDTYTIKQK